MARHRHTELARIRDDLLSFKRRKLNSAEADRISQPTRNINKRKTHIGLWVRNYISTRRNIGKKALFSLSAVRFRSGDGKRFTYLIQIERRHVHAYSVLIVRGNHHFKKVFVEMWVLFSCSGLDQHSNDISMTLTRSPHKSGDDLCAHHDKIAESQEVHTLL